jgi:hypothetical protein
MTRVPLRIAGTALLLLLGPGSALSQQPAQQPPQPPAQQHPMSFFVTSQEIGKGGDLGGVAGADAHCRQLATAAGAGSRTWHAYLSTQPRDGQPAVNARDRIGQGPWYNAKGDMIAKGLADLHGDTIELARLGNNVTKLSALTEKGEIVAGLNDNPDPKDRTWAYASTHPNSNRHEMLTGSTTDGRAYLDVSVDRTCNNWTSSAEGSGQIRGNVTGAAAEVGLSDRNGGGNGSWNSAHPTGGCSQEALTRSHGVGLFYCFATD